MNILASFVRRQPVLTFGVVAFAVAWPVSLAAFKLIPLPVEIPVVAALLLVSFAPAAGALVVLAVQRSPDENRAFRRRLLRWRVGLRWYAVAALLPAAVFMAGASLFRLLGELTQQWAALAYLPLILVFNLGEEIGWRGFAFPHLQSRYGPQAASVVLGLMWGFLHLGLYVDRPVIFVEVVGLTVAQAIIMTWIFNRTGGSILLMTLWHSSFDMTSQIFTVAEGSSLVNLLALVGLAMWGVAAIVAGRLGSGVAEEDGESLRSA